MRSPNLLASISSALLVAGVMSLAASFAAQARADDWTDAGTDARVATPPVAQPTSRRVAILFDEPATMRSARSDAVVCAGGPGPCAPTCAETARACQSFFDSYVPVVPVGPSRSTFTTMVVPPTPWLLTQGEAGTPECGRVGFNLTRVSDERVFSDHGGNTYESDGEVQVAVLEAVSPRLHADVGRCDVAYHLAVSVSAYSLNYAWWDGMRNFVEEDLLGAEQSIIDSHTLQGRELSITDPGGSRTNLLDSSPLWKVGAAMKFPIPDARVGCHRLSSAFTVAFAGPAFGSHHEIGNYSVQGDATLAAALPLSERFRLTSALNLGVPGKSRDLERFGVDHQTVIFGGVFGIEWWATRSFAVGLGATVNSPYTKHSGLPTDLTSVYVNFGLLWRVSPRAEFHALFSENPGGKIAVNGTPSSDYSFDTQRDADFSVTIGGSFSL